MYTEFWEAVRERAHQLWIEDGCVDGRSEEHWQQAQREVLESKNAVAPEPVDQPTDPDPTSALPWAATEAASEADPAPETITLPHLVALTPALSHGKGASLFKIGMRQCRFITSPTYSPTIFCGAPTKGGSWCEEHRARVFIHSAARPAIRPVLKTPSARQPELR